MTFAFVSKLLARLLSFGHIRIRGCGGGRSRGYVIGNVGEGISEMMKFGNVDRCNVSLLEDFSDSF